MIEVH